MTGEPVDTADRVKGYQVAKGQYVMVEDDELEALKIESTRTIDIETFVPAGRGRPDLSRQPLLPRARRQGRRGGVRRDPRGHDQEEDGRHRPRRAGQARAHADAGAARQRHAGDDACAIPTRCAQGAESSTSIGDAKLPAEMLDIAQEIINRMSGHFEPESFTDRYEEAVVAMLRPSRRARPSRCPRPPAPANVVNIMDALKKSLEAEGGEARRRRPRAPSKKAASARRQAGRAQAGGQEPRRARRRAEAGGGVPLAGQTLFLVGRLPG